MTTKKGKPLLSFWQIWNMSIGFLGIQMGFALQNANASRILQTFGADVEHLSWFWLVAPFTGMIIQPIIGHYSDKTWTKLGRRRPFFLAGAILATIGLILMPNADLFVDFLPALWVGAGFLMMMDASFNVAMEPFRALVADKLNNSQQTLGFSIQTVLIGIGAVVGSWLPYVLTEWFGFEKTTEAGKVPFSLVFSFIVGAFFLLTCIIWTIIKTPEYSPKEQAEFEGDEHVEEEQSSFFDIFKDFGNMPKTMKQLGIVQFFSWFGLFSMWVFMTRAIAQHIYNLPADDSSSEQFNNAANWVGVIFGVYNAVSAIYAFMLPKIAENVGKKRTHAYSLLIGGISLISIYFITDYRWLILPMIGVGFAWASILAMPYAILAGAIPAKKMGIYMGIFNFFITIPQIVNGIIGGPIVKYLYNNQAIYAIIGGGVCFLLAAFSVRFVEEKID
ncbi:major facilitator superfamily MFS_1 [Emticicia oligotrophica DSM 17448]|uniref:Major facilitator superfamily MFS_1 n=1 Tax=Emticicia oligotrophica (strain DSM 17448 / CIP 109782 / MTCC 6937 / GPTSA100-15) TaxID=929562 RepID=A0ABM5N6R7_EMTOG|nr:MFS transporter [Emticicia oligotrophica]AFK05167.1 major facilitator superfamily MFS_1 [Emticicia oligotrophica DSM 17448]